MKKRKNWLVLAVLSGFAVLAALSIFFFSGIYERDTVFFDPTCGNGICEVMEGESVDTCPEDCLGKEYLSFYLDVGSLEDNDTAEWIFLDSTNFSDRQSEGGVSFRSISFENYAEFYVNTSELVLSEQGVPIRDAILTVRYFDDYDETDCADRLYSSKSSECRHRVDVFLNHSDLEFYSLLGMGGVDDGQWKQSKLFMEKTPWQTLRSVDGLMRFRFSPNQHSDSGGSWKIASVNLTFVPETEFLSLREQDRQDRGLIRSDFVESYTADYGDEGDYVVYSRHYLEKVYPNSVPREDELTNELDIFEVGGNHEPLTFSVYAVNDLIDVNVSVTDLVKGSDIISSDDIDIMNVIFSDLRWSSTWSSSYGTNPNYLDPFETVNMSAGESRQFWLNVYVPEDASPGVYKGKINVSFENSPEAEINISIEVFNLDLTDAKAFPAIYGDPEYNEFISEEVVLQDIADHGLYPIINFDPEISYSQAEQKVIDIDYGEEITKLTLWQGYGLVKERSPIFVNDDKKSRIWIGGCGGVNDYYQRECGEFDEEYGGVVLNYSDFVGSYGVLDTAFSFLDEPHFDPGKRRTAVRLNRIAKSNDLSTWVTYKTFTDMPLAGHYINFYDKPGVDFAESWPEWIDNGLEMHLNFEEGFEDVSGNGHNGIPGGGAYISEGALVMDADDFVQIEGTFESNDSTVIAIIEPSSNSDVHQRILRFNGRLILSYHGLSENLLMRTYDSEGEIRSPYPSTDLCGLNELCFVVGSYSDEFGAQKIYCDGDLVGEELDESGDGLRASESNYIGSMGSNENFEGRIESVLVFNRTLSDLEVQELFAYTSATNYNRKQEMNLTTEILVGEETPSALAFSLSDNKGIGLSAPLKMVLVDSEVIWERVNLDYEHQVFEVDLSSYLVDGNMHNITVRLVNNITFEDEILIYFMDQYWRDAVWDYEFNSDNWSASFMPDEYLDNFGPVGPYIDHRIYHISSVNGRNLQRVGDEGKMLGYYTTYQANMPYPINNRFLNGIYADSVDVSYVMAYAYHTPIGDPYDDLSRSWQGRDFGDALKGNVDYNLVYPAWDGNVRKRLIYESLREGVEDARIISTLEKVIQDNPGSLANEAQTYLEGLRSKFSADYNPDYMVSGRSDSWLRHDFSKEILTDLSESSDDYDSFDEARRTMIDYIIAIKNQQDDSDDPGDGDDPDDPGDDDDPPGPGGGDDPGDDDDCEEEWICEDWGECVNGTRTRECRDTRLCGTTEDKPLTEESCDPEFLTGGGEEEEGDELDSNARFDLYFAGAIAGLGIIGVFVGVAIFILRERFKKKFGGSVDVRY